MVVDIFQHLHDEYIAATESQYFELWYDTNAVNDTWDPTPCEDEIPF